MKKRFTEEQIVKILNEGETGTIKDICRRYGISDVTFYNWRNKYSGMGISEVKRLKNLELENNRLKRILAERDLEIDTLRDIMKKN